MAPGTARGRTTAMDNDGRRRTTNGDNGQRWIPWVYTNPDHVEVTMRSSSTPRTRSTPSTGADVCLCNAVTRWQSEVTIRVFAEGGAAAEGVD